MNEIGNEIGKSTLFRRRGDCFQNNQKPITLGVLLKNKSNCPLQN